MLPTHPRGARQGAVPFAWDGPLSRASLDALNCPPLAHSRGPPCAPSPLRGARRAAREGDEKENGIEREGSEREGPGREEESGRREEHEGREPAHPGAGREDRLRRARRGGRLRRGG